MSCVDFQLKEMVDFSRAKDRTCGHGHEHEHFRYPGIANYHELLKTLSVYWSGAEGDNLSTMIKLDRMNHDVNRSAGIHPLQHFADFQTSYSDSLPAVHRYPRWCLNQPCPYPLCTRCKLATTQLTANMNAIRATAALNQRELDAAIPISASWHVDYRDTAWLYVGGFPPELSEGDIITIFSQYGNPTHLNLIRERETGKSKGFGFLKYEDQRSCDLAVDNLGGAEVLGRVLRVDHTRYKRKDGESEETYSIERLEREGAGEVGTAIENGSANGNGKRGSDSDEEGGQRKRRKRDRLALKERDDTGREVAMLADSGDEEDPMKDYIRRERREEAAKGKASDRDRPHKHHHRHRDNENGDAVEKKSRHKQRSRHHADETETVEDKEGERERHSSNPRRRSRDDGYHDKRQNGHLSQDETKSERKARRRGSRERASRDHEEASDRRHKGSDRSERQSRQSRSPDHTRRRDEADEEKSSASKPRRKGRWDNE